MSHTMRPGGHWVKLMVLSMSWNLGNVLARNRHVHRSIFQRRNSSRIVCWLFDLYCGLRLLCLRLWHSNGAWARMVSFWNFGRGRGVVCHGCMARLCCSHRHHVLFCFPVEIARKGGAKLIEMAESGERAVRKNVKSQGAISQLKDLGVTPSNSSRWQKLASLDDEAFEEKLAAVLKKEISA